MAKQKAKVHLLMQGDNNTEFFHDKAKARRRINTFKRVKDSSGNWQEEPEDITSTILEFYTALLGPPNIGQNMDVGNIRNLFCSKIPRDSYDSLERIPTSTENKDVLFSIPSSKSPGPDCNSSDFFKICQDIVGYEVTTTNQYFFQIEFLLKEWNAIAVTLIPKKKTPPMLPITDPQLAAGPCINVCPNFWPTG